MKSCVVDKLHFKLNYFVFKNQHVTKVAQLPFIANATTQLFNITNFYKTNPILFSLPLSLQFFKHGEILHDRSVQ